VMKQLIVKVVSDMVGKRLEKFKETGKISGLYIYSSNSWYGQCNKDNSGTLQNKKSFLTW